MTEIRVIVDDGSKTDIASMSTEEREIYFEQLGDALRNIPRVHINALLKLIEHGIQDNSLFVRPEINELLLRKAIQLGKGAIIPIITNKIGDRPITGSAASINQIRIAPKSQSATSKAPNARSIGFNPAPIVKNSIIVQFDKPILTQTTSGLNYIAPAGKELHICGIIIRDICDIPLSISLDEAPRMTSIPILSRIISDIYNYFICAHDCTLFDHPDFPKIFGHNIIGSEQFFDKQLRNDIISQIYNYVISAEKYYRSLDAAYYISAQIRDGNVHDKLISSLRSHHSDKVDFAVGKLGKLSDAAARVQEIYNGRLITIGNNDNAPNFALLFDIIPRGLDLIYYRAIEKGIDNPNVDAAIKNIQASFAAKRSMRQANAKYMSEQNDLNTYRNIIANKYGQVRLNEIDKLLAANPMMTTEAKNILDLLKPAERKPIELEFQHRKTYLEAYLNNKCPHIPIYKKLRSIKNTDEQHKIFNDLKKFFKVNEGITRSKSQTTTNDDMIMCNRCNFPIICPHVVDLTNADFDRKKFEEIKAIMSKYIHDTATSYSFCKICGEIIAAPGEFAIAPRDPNQFMDEELRDFIWAEVAILMKYLKFNRVINVSHVISAVRDMIYSFIFDIDKQIRKSKTNSADEIKAKKRLYVAIYAFAALIHLMSIDRDITFKGVNSKAVHKNIVVDQIKYAIDTIMLSKNIIIREIPSMTIEVIKNSLIEAYKSIQKVRTYMPASIEAESIAAQLILDPVFIYFFRMNHYQNAKSLGGTNTSNIIRDIEYTLGDSLSRLEKSSDLFARANVPNVIGASAFDKLAKLDIIDVGYSKIFGQSDEADNTSGSKPDSNFTKYTKYTKHTNDIFINAVPGYITKSFHLFAQKVKTGLYREFVYTYINSDDKTSDIPEPVFRSGHARYYEACDEILAVEDKLRLFTTVINLQTYGILPHKETRQWVDHHVGLGRIYDENGQKHIWNIFVVNQNSQRSDKSNDKSNASQPNDNILSNDSTSNEITINDIVKNLEVGKYIVYQDRKCSVCGILRSECSRLSDTKIRTSIRRNNNIDNFFKFYEYRCPKGGLHEFVADICAKCSIHTSYINVISDARAKYYDEYKQKYFDEKASLVISALQNIIPHDAHTSSYTPKSYAEYDSWVPNINILTDLANRIGVNYHLLTALGAYEQQDIAQIRNGSYIPREEDDKYGTRTYIIDSFIKNLLTEYNQLRLFAKIIKPDPNLAAIIDKSGISRHRLSDIKLPDIYDDYNEILTYVRGILKPRDIVAFCIQRFCEMCLKILDDNNAETAKLRKDFVTYFVNKTLRFEELITKPGYFNWSILYGEKEIKEKVADSNYDRNLGDDHAAVDDDTETPMSLDAFDIEEDPDDEDAAEVDISDTYVDT